MVTPSGVASLGQLPTCPAEAVLPWATKMRLTIYDRRI